MLTSTNPAGDEFALKTPYLPKLMTLLGKGQKRLYKNELCGLFA